MGDAKRAAGETPVPQDREVIERFKAWYQSEGLSQAKAGKLLGCSGPSLSGIEAGTYKGQMAMYAGRMRKHMERVDRRSLAPKGLEHYGLKRTSVTAECIASIRAADDCRMMAAILGAHGIGKTKALEQYLAVYPQVVLLTLHSRGSVTKPPSARAPLMALANALKVRHDSSTSNHDMITRLGHALKESQRMVIVDEIDHAAEPLLQSLRQVHDVAGNCLILVGTMAFLEGLRRRKSATLNQFLSRVGYVTYLDPIVDEDVEALLEPFGLDKAALAVAREGAHGIARRLDFGIKAAQRLAAEEGVKLTADTMARAFQKLLEE